MVWIEGTLPVKPQVFLYSKDAYAWLCNQALYRFDETSRIFYGYQKFITEIRALFEAGNYKEAIDLIHTVRPHMFNIKTLNY